MKLTKEELLESFPKKRTNYCPVRQKAVTEYLVPIDLVTRDTKNNQPRLNDSTSERVAEIREDIFDDGLILGVCCEWKRDEEGNFVLVVVWGNTRYRASLALTNMKKNAPEMPAGHIWLNIYGEPEEDKLRLQGIENNLHKPASKATKEDNALVIGRMIEKGQLDQDGSKYKDTPSVEKRERAKEKYLKMGMPSQNFTSVWNIIKKKDKSTLSCFRTWDKTGDMVKYFNAHNPWGVSIEKSGDIVVVNGQRISVYLQTAPKTEYKGAAPANTTWSRNVNKKCDKSLWVTSCNTSTEGSVHDMRSWCKETVGLWHTAQPECISQIWFMPQTQREQENEMIVGGFVGKVVFEELPPGKRETQKFKQEPQAVDC